MTARTTLLPPDESEPVGNESEWPYLFERPGEEDRLVAQARYLKPFTERLFRAAGLSRGMRVLDLGSGAGDVAFLAARLVGRRGAVVGVERSPERLGAARARAAEMGFRNVSFVRGDVRRLDMLGSFDAVVGRFILMHVASPSEVLRSAAAHVRPGGVVAIHEMELSWGPSVPPAPLWERSRRWFLETFARAGLELHMGLRLSATFVEAGLPSPLLTMEAVTAAGPESFAYDWAEDTMRAILPAVERLGVERAAEVQVDSLARRLRDEAARLGAVVIWPPFVGAWARTAADGGRVRR